MQEPLAHPVQTVSVFRVLTQPVGEQRTDTNDPSSRSRLRIASEAPVSRRRMERIDQMQIASFLDQQRVTVGIQTGDLHAQPVTDTTGRRVAQVVQRGQQWLRIRA